MTFVMVSGQRAAGAALAADHLDAGRD